MRTNLRRSVVALSTTLACLALMAGPASAGAHGAVISSGAMLISNSTSTVQQSVPFGGTAGAGCGSNIVINDDHTQSPAEVSITTFSSTGRFTLTSTMTDYIVVTSLGGNTTGIVPSPGNFNGSSVTLRMDFHLTAAIAPSCALGNRLCRLTVTLPLSATYTSTGTSFQSSSDIGIASGDGGLASAVGVPCNVPFSQFIGGTADIAGSHFHVTS